MKATPVFKYAELLNHENYKRLFLHSEPIDALQNKEFQLPY